MAITSIRWSCTKALCTTLSNAAGLVGVTVDPTWPGDKYERPEMVWVDRLTGDVEIAVMTGPTARHIRNDMFEIPFRVQVAGRSSVDEAVTRIEEMIGTIESVLALDPGLDDFDGVLSAEVTHDEYQGFLTPDGPLALGEVIVSVHSRLL